MLGGPLYRAAASLPPTEKSAHMFEDTEVHVVASNLKFPENPVIGADGSVFVCEVDGGALVRVSPDGTRTVVADIGRGANGAAFGPDGAIYVGSSGGFDFAETGEGTRGPIALSANNEGGFIHRVDPATGEYEEVITECDGLRLRGLNDWVFDANGAAYVADTVNGIIFYFDPIAKSIQIAAAELVGPNGLGLSPDGSRLYGSETFSGRIRAWDVVGAGKLVELPDLFHHPQTGTEGAWFWDGLAIDGAGNVAVADLLGFGIRVISPEGTELGFLPVPQQDPSVTCIAFGGPEGNTAYITSGGRGTLYSAEWPFPGHRVNFQPA